ncbi:MAG: TonB-dependent receptor plug domain-containing protein [Nitrospirae bacterium YQR-1]
MRFFLNLLLLCSALSLTCSNLFALTAEESDLLSLYFKKEDLVITPTKYLKTTSQVAENIVVITARDIEAINAACLADVLKYVTGMQTKMIPGGRGIQPYVQGTEMTTHTRIIIDGVTLNDIAINATTPENIPVEHIERIEIIKGPASSTWGSSLGGIINIITKDGDIKKAIGGKIQASYGAYSTQDERGVLTGKAGPLEYYLFYGRNFSYGYNSELFDDQHHFYGKLRYNPAWHTALTYTLGYDQTSREPVIPSLVSYNKSLYSTLSMSSKLSESADLNVSLRTSDFDNKVEMPNGNDIVKDTNYGGGASLKWTPPGHAVVLGGDYDYQTFEYDKLDGGKAYFKKLAIFANDTFNIGKLTITPGIRYDSLTNGGTFISPSFGVIYDLGKATLLRFFVARGFNSVAAKHTSVTIQAGDSTFLANPDLKVEKVISYQGGIESGILKYLWLKASLFRHNVWDAITLKTVSSDTFQMQNYSKQLRQGFEIEAETVPFYNITLSTGFSYTHIKNIDTGEYVTNTPRYSYDLGVHYRHPKILDATLKGHYIRWYYDPSEYNNYYTFTGNNSMIFDLNLSREIYRDANITTGLYIKGTNIFNDSLVFYANRLYNGRIIQGGLKVNF